jgi:drug/metabolite transporter (DMT)-like permease
MSKFKVLTAGLAAVVLWAGAFPAIRVAAPDLGVIGLSVVRLAVASVALLAGAPLAHVRLPERRHLPLLVAAAFFGMTAYQLLLNAAELHVPAGTASIVVAAAPLVSVAIATLFLGEQLTVTRVAGSVVAIGGVVAVSLARSGATVTSALLIVAGAAVVQGIYHPLIKRLLRDRSGLEVATYAMVAGTIMSLPLLRGAGTTWSAPRRLRGVRRSTSRCCPPPWGSCCGDTPWRTCRWRLRPRCSTSCRRSPS